MITSRNSRAGFDSELTRDTVSRQRICVDASNDSINPEKIRESQVLKSRESVDQIQVLLSINNFALDMLNRVDLPSLLQHIVKKTDVLTRADYAYVAMVHESGEYLETIAATDDMQSLKSVCHKYGEGIGGQVWLTGSTVSIPDYQNYPHRLPGLTTARQACGVPLKLDDEVIGVIGLMYENYDECIEDQVELLEMFAPVASVAIENATLHKNTRVELQRTKAIGEISRDIYGSASFDSIIDRICLTVIESFDVTKAHLYRFDNDETFKPLAAWEQKELNIVRASQVDGATVAQSIARWCIENNKIGFIKRGQKDPRETPLVHKIREKWKLGSTLCIPLSYKSKSWGVLFVHRTIDRSDFTIAERNLFEVIGAQISVALLRRELMEQIQHQAFHDGLTGQFNRFRFESLLTDTVERDRDKGGWFAIMFIDLDGFKAINDTYGHNTGDDLLKQAGSIISAQLTEEDILARIGGDEFAVIVEGRSSHDDVYALAHCLNASLQTGLRVNALQADVGASIGISYFPSDAGSASEMLQHADFAMYHAKSEGRGCIAAFDRSYMEVHEKRTRLERDLRRALDDNEFILHYQPKVNCKTAHVDSAEALLRWIHPVLGNIPPSEFIPVAERCGLIEAIGSWVLDQACRQCAQYLNNGQPLSIAVNISARQFGIDNFVQDTFDVIDKYNLPASLLELEVTESVVMKDIDLVVSKLSQLRERGVRIAIDDFGTGYSSLQYLAELPLDVLKIDKTFIDKLEGESSDMFLIKTIVMMATELNLETVAEGVESHRQVRELSALGCDYIQGYIYSRPVPATELPAMVNAIRQQNIQ